MVTGLARLGGRPVRVVANQPRHLGGVIDVEASEKAARFVATCDALGVLDAVIAPRATRARLLAGLAPRG